jgi:hypothetical protein
MWSRSPGADVCIERDRRGDLYGISKGIDPIRGQQYSFDKASPMRHRGINFVKTLQAPSEYFCGQMAIPFLSTKKIKKQNQNKEEKKSRWKNRLDFDV